MALTYFSNRIKILSRASLPILLFITLGACSAGGSSSSSPTPTPPGTEELQISPFAESAILLEESTTATISIINPSATESAVVAITSNNNSVISVTPSSCNLSTAVPSCTVKITGIGAGSANFTASSTGISSVTSGTIVVTTVPPVIPDGILFGTQNGLVFGNGSLIAGNTPLATLDTSNVQGVVIDSSGNIYAGTAGSAFGGFGGGGSLGKVYKYNSSLGYWTVLAGNSAGGSLDNSSITGMVIDSSNNLYAGTTNNNVFRYSNGIWNLMGGTLSQPVQTLALDSSNNLYAGTNNGSSSDNEVFKYVNGTWVSLGSPDGTGIQSIAINSNGHIYAATNGNGGDGQVYRYAAGVNWAPVSAFNEGAVNVIAISGLSLYCGTTTNGLVYKYDGSGTSWTSLGNPDSINSSSVISLAVTSSEVYAGTSGNTNDGIGGVYSYNSGTSSWDSTTTVPGGVTISVLTLNNSALYIGTTSNGNNGAGMVYSYSTNRWTPFGTGALDGTTVYSVTLDNNGNLYAGTQNNVLKYLADNKMWILLGNLGASDGSGTAALAAYNDNIYAGMNSGNVYTSTNQGGSWIQIATNQDHIISDTIVNSSGQLYISLNYNDPIDQIIKDGSVRKYENSTNTWTSISGPGPHDSINTAPIQSITLDTAGNLYATTTNGNNVSAGYVWKYPAGGTAWAMLGTGSPDGSSVNSVITDSNLNVYAGTTNGNVFKYSGLNWIQLNLSPLDIAGVSSLSFDHDGNLYASTYGGMVWEYPTTSSLWINTNYGIYTSINTAGSIGF